MLVATPGQTTAYHPTLHGSSSSSNNSSTAPKQICHSSSSNSTSSSTAAVVAKSTLNNKLPAETSARSGSVGVGGGNGTTSSLMKTLSVRLNRGTDFLKGTVQKALVSTTNITTNTTTIPNSTNNNNNNNNNTTTNTTTTNSHSDINAINPNKAVAATTAAATTTTTLAKTTALTHVSSSSSSSIFANRPIVGTSSGVSAGTANVVRSSNSGNSSHNLSTNVTTSRIIAAASSTGCSATTRLKLYTVPPTVIHRHPEERLRTSSVDSLHKEMCHFKPIRAAPTTPFKSCTKSRGVSLKTPKANLATKFNLHANCDVSKTWVEQEGSGNGSGSGKVSESDQHLDESNLYKYFKPKPSSTVLTTIISTPTHQSAFVCLVAQMKNISTDSSSKGSLNKMNVHKPRTDRGRRKSTGRKTGRGKSIATVGTVTRQKVSLHKGRNPFVHVKKLHLPADLIISRTLRAAREAKKGLSVLQPRTPTTTPPPIKSAKRGNAGKNRNGKTRSQVALNRGRPRGKIAPDIKEVTGVNIIEHKNRGKPATGVTTNTTATTANVAGGGAGENHRRVRKRKILDLTEADESAQPMARKSARISKDCNNESSSSLSATTRETATAAATAAGLPAATKSPMKITTTGNKGKRATGNAGKRGRGSRHTSVTSSRVSPPLTRARLKQMSNGKLLTALDY